ncbi:DUF2461 domain-containing protein [Aquiflexum lacus]|uniref:DUF2461 domain-containing protein n=1 Tax=Aquiflexum lacus TaxID=2483805 RepID=UPI001894EF67|nr:DUF2461 domain-containing protein [Aquiflexum lacus]
MKTIKISTLEFLENLSQNNHKEWFQANKSKWDQAKENFIEFIGSVLHEITAKENIIFDEPKKYIGRINRDIRFSNDKSPYNDYITSMIFRDPHKNTTPFYIRIQNGNSLMGCGIKSPDSGLLKKIRQYIDLNGEELNQILEDSAIKATFGDLEGDVLKRPPQGFDADHPHLIFLLKKEFLLTTSIPNETLISNELHKNILSGYQTALPFMKFMDRAIGV